MTTRSHVLGSARRAALLLAAAVAAVGAVAVLALPAPPAAAADLSRFDPGYIISDENFWDAGAMDVAGVQAFLNARGASCTGGSDGSACLKNVRTDTNTRPADDRCRGGYTGRSGESAAEIVVRVAQSCGVSPRVLLVTLQKEQGLVTTTAPTAGKYRAAMGFGCPDTAACDSKYYGFFNQVYQAAWQFRSYALTPTRWQHRAGVVNNVRFHPDAGCGTSAVLIRNQATAGLYNYTPYQPNAAALAAGYGTGNACSAYGNRNFFAYYSDWFGSPNGVPPIGVVDAVTANNSAITVQGWALDPDTTDPIGVHVYVDGVGTALVADAPRPDVGAVHGRGDRHGFSHTSPQAPGRHTVCTFAINAGPGANTLLECRDVVVPDAVPIGGVTSVTTTGTSLTMTGWSLDPDTSAPNQVHVYVDGVGRALTADQPRPDIAAAYGLGDKHGFTFTTDLAPGAHQVCVFGINTAAAAHTLLDCRTVTVGADRAPVGVIEGVSVSGTQVSVSGWTFDPDTTGPTQAHIYIDGVGAAVLADGPRADVAAVFGAGPASGYAHTRTLAPGDHQVCVYGINTGKGPHTLLGCRSVVVAPDRAPVGVIEGLTLSGTQLSVSGWTFDPDTTGPTQAHIYIDGVGAAVTADGARPDVAAVFGAGPRTGYAHTRTVGPGTHQVCVYGISTGPGPHTLLGCRSITATPDRAPVGVIEGLSVTGGQLSVSGWTFDPDTTAPTQAHVYIDGVGAAVTADGPRPDVAAVFGSGPATGYAHTRPVAPGTHQVCVYGINTGTGPHTLLGCRTLTS
ncbi:hypothetical protein [Cellulomonas sp. NS3]|uniref:hypothetical protein n=1 Tax=Cellulomonas sp. NS3 TaxID=2973977 RepID=UPI002161EEC9|nr:hypothetical protein [Cellulomonas sp. NS3]